MKCALLLFSFILLSGCSSLKKKNPTGLMCYTPYNNQGTICGEVETYRDGDDVVFYLNRDSIIRPRSKAD